MISVDEALKIVLDSAKLKQTVSIPLHSASGFTLAEAIHSRENIPGFDNSGVDGYALRAEDLAGASETSEVILEVIDTVYAGDVSKKRVTRGKAIRIMTGARLPKGADSVVMVEFTKTTGKFVHVRSSVKPEENLRYTGDDIGKSELVFNKGHILRPYDLGVLASIGISQVRVAAKPIVAILATGDELVLPHQKLKTGKVRASSSVALIARLRELGFDAVDLGIARDTPVETLAKLKKAFKADVIFTTGGVSMGEKDYVRSALEKLGVKIRFWKVKQKPGKPLVFGTAGKKLFFGLPGNPVSSLICFELYGLPTLKKMAGLNESLPKINVIIEKSISKKPGLRHFLRAKLVKKDGSLFAELTGNQSSGILTSLSYADVLLDLPESETDIPAGKTVDAYVLNSEKYFSPR